MSEASGFPPLLLLAICFGSNSHSRIAKNERKRWTGNSVCWHSAGSPTVDVDARFDQECVLKMLDARRDRFIVRALEFVRRLSHRDPRPNFFGVNLTGRVPGSDARCPRYPLVGLNF